MFAALKNYKNEEFCRQHKEITLEFEGNEKTYQIFAVVKVDLTDVDSFLFEKLPQTEKEKADYVDDLLAAAFWLSGDKVTASDEILLLSTCDYDAVCYSCKAG
jgi:sortase B